MAAVVPERGDRAAPDLDRGHLQPRGREPAGDRARRHPDARSRLRRARPATGRGLRQQRFRLLSAEGRSRGFGAGGPELAARRHERAPRQRLVPPAVPDPIRAVQLAIRRGGLQRQPEAGAGGELRTGRRAAVRGGACGRRSVLLAPDERHRLLPLPVHHLHAGRSVHRQCGDPEPQSRPWELLWVRGLARGAAAPLAQRRRQLHLYPPGPDRPDQRRVPA